MRLQGTYQHKQQNIVNLQTVPLYKIGTYYNCDVLTVISSTTVYLTSVIDADPRRPSTSPKHYNRKSPFLRSVQPRLLCWLNVLSLDSASIALQCL